ncbi:DUF5696 domain-containing protein [Paenibacillus sp. VCA1]|uniref:DUF5696 domain-containing protein n=1 Tax=Paenibacillus sp. VCA1 TaxID=3039148 RepID=UPI002870FDDC|nr:DUF5696 domain-containing protein [Paenibacillus sp. VCA1]MDR9855723.1 DUF5696 domain-containing protein [Paenibacillus sp. VCA1]
MNKSFTKKWVLPVAVTALLLLAAGIWMLLPRTENPSAVISEAEHELDASRVHTAALQAKAKKAWAPESGPAPEGMKKMAESNQLTLYMNPKTTEFAVKYKPSGRIWYSNPPSREEDTIASGRNKGRLSALFSLSYLNASGQNNELDSFMDSVELGQFTTEPLQDGVRVMYTVGEIVRGIESIPKVISKQRFEERILNQLTDKKDINEIKKRFKYDDDRGVYTRREMSELALQKALAIMDEVGYGDEDLAYDNKENNIEAEAGADQAQFMVPVDIRLEGDQLVVHVDAGAIKQLGTLPIQTLTLLEYFGAADTRASGYLFVPDGSGALIHLNNGKTVEPAFHAPVYGEENAITSEERLTDNDPVRLPVFGMKQKDGAWLGIIEKGEAIASIKADVSGRLNSYNYTAPMFTLLNTDRVVIKGGSVTVSNPVHQKNPYKGDITVRYGFLAGEDADYSGMARLYRDYLVQTAGLRKLEPMKDIPFILELAGGVETRKSLLGVPYDSVAPLTTYDQAKELIERLKERQVNQIKLRYTGWFNGGINHRVASHISFDSAVGGEKSFKQFSDYLHSSGIPFYPDAAFMSVYHNGSGFQASRDGIKYMSQQTVSQYKVDMPTFLLVADQFSHYPLSPVRLPNVVKGFIDDAKPLGLGGLSLRDLGDTVYSDFDSKKEVNRQETRLIAESQISALAHNFPDLLANGGNAYALPYVQTIVNAPTAANGFNIEDETVPFYELVLHGYADLAGKPFNQAEDQFSRANILKAIETGTNVYYRWVAELPEELTSPVGLEMYANEYGNWLDEAIQAYQEVNEALRSVRHLAIQKHERLMEGVYETVYEDGTSIIVNYNDKPVEVKGARIDAESYRMGGH